MNRWPWALLALLAVLACGGEDSSPRQRLLPVPEPDLGNAEVAVREQVGAQLAAVAAQQEKEPLPATALGEAYGELGLIYVTYSFIEAAEVCFLNSRILMPGDARWPYLLGYLYQIQGRLPEAAEVLEGALELKPDDAPSRIRLGTVKLEQGEHGRAQSLFARALELDPNAAAALDGLGKVAAATGDPASAADYFARALEVQPGAASVRHGLGLALRQLGRLEEARAQLERSGDAPALFQDPLLARVTELGRSAELYLVRAAQAFSEERFDIAAESYRQALELEPGDFTARKALGFCLQKLGDLDAAQEQLYLALELGSTGDADKDQLERAEVYRILGGLEVLSGRDAKALEHFETSLELDPDRLDTHLKLANALARARRFEEAVSHYDRVLEEQSESAGILVLRATALVNLGRRGAALADFERALAAAPDDPDVQQRYAAALEYFGDSRAAREMRARASGDSAAALARAPHDLVRQGRFDEAITGFRDALAQEPGATDTRFELAKVLGHVGRLDEALGELTRVIDEAPRHGPARRAEVTALVLGGRHGQARQRLEDGLRVMPRDRGLAHALARLLAAAPREGIRDGERAVQVATQLLQVQQELAAAETLAMAYAESGRLSQAAELQARLLSEAESGGAPVEILSPMRQRLQAYRAGQPWRAESPDDLLAILAAGSAG